MRVNSLTIIHTGPTLVFDPVLLADNGDYSCTPRNDVGQGEPTTFNFIVNGKLNNVIAKLKPESLNSIFPCVNACVLCVESQNGGWVSNQILK